MALPRGRAAVPFAVAPADATAALRRLTSTWSQPEPWIVSVLLVTGVVVVARHPLAKMIGTEVDGPTAVPLPVAAAPVVPGATQTSAPTAGLAAVPTHAPRDPFRALVGASGAVLAPEAVTPASGTTTHRAHRHAVQPPAPTGATDTCAGTTHTVVSGDTLWTIAARAVKSSDSKRVTVAWHRIYRANRPPLSAPGMLPVGAKLCLPASL